MAEFSEEVRPRYRVFLSADLHGSTRLKQSEATDYSVDEDDVHDVSEPRFPSILLKYRPTWFSTIEYFFNDFYDIFETEFNLILQGIRMGSIIENPSDTLLKALNENPPVEIEVWKTIGDEIIFVSEVFDTDQISILCYAFKEAIINFRRVSLNKFSLEKGGSGRSHYNKMQDRGYADTGIDLKGCIWTAGFPATNKEIVSFKRRTEDEVLRYRNHNPTFTNFDLLRRWYSEDQEKKENLSIDYIGPSIDTGFRLSTLSTPRKLMISSDTAFLLSVSELGKRLERDIKIGYDGRIELRGVLSGEPYPAFWIKSSLPNGLAEKEGDVLGMDYFPDYGKISSFCREFFAQKSHTLDQPRIYTDHLREIQGLPRDIEAFLVSLDTIWKNERDRDQGLDDL